MKKLFSYMFEEYVTARDKNTTIIYIGDMMYVELSSGIYAKVEFPQKGEPIYYVRFSVISRTCGIIDSCDVSFSSVFTSGEEKKYIGSDYAWKGNPTMDDFDNLAESFLLYLNMWKE